MSFQSGRKKHAPEKMGDVISQLMARRGYAQSISTDEVRSAWAEVAGPLSADSLPGHLRRGVLEIHVSDSMVLQEMTFQKQSLLAEMKNKLPKSTIKDLRFRVSSI